MNRRIYLPSDCRLGYHCGNSPSIHAVPSSFLQIPELSETVWVSFRSHQDTDYLSYIQGQLIWKIYTYYGNLLCKMGTPSSWRRVSTLILYRSWCLSAKWISHNWLKTWSENKGGCLHISNSLPYTNKYSASPDIAVIPPKRIRIISILSTYPVSNMWVVYSVVD